MESAAGAAYRHIWWQGEDSNSCGVPCAGHFCSMPDHEATREGVDEWVILYCAGGSGSVICGAQSAPVTARAGMVFCLPANTPHTYRACASEPWDLYWFHCRGLLDNELMDALPLVRELSAQAAREVQAHITALLQEMEQAPGALRTAKCRALAQLALLTCAQARPANTLMEQAKLWLETHCRGDESMADIAAHFGVSEYHFIRAFRAYAGMPPHRYRLTARMRTACALLEDEALSVAQVSEALGFASPYYFSRQFKQLTGYSPRAYRTTVRCL